MVVASSPHPLVVFPAVSIARLSGAKFVFEVRDLWPEILVQLGRFGRRHPYVWILKLAERYAVKTASKVLSVKPGDWEYFSEQYGLPHSRFAYVPNGFYPAPAKETVPETIKSLKKDYAFVVGYTGAISTYYGLEHFLGLAKRFKSDPDVGFVIVGEGDGRRALEQQVAEEDLTNVHLVGVVPKEAITATLALFDVCYVGLQDISLHKYGISCNKIFEYMYAAKPILGSYRAGFDPVKEAGCGVVASPGDYETLVAAIRRFRDDPTLAAEYGNKGRAFFDAHHDFRVVARQLVAELFPGENPAREAATG
jgi:glycosyltransferase involved in cell wall biosynthesis